MLTAAVIAAGGRGVRTEAPLPKQYATIGGQSVLARTLAAFLEHPCIDLVQPVIGGGDEPLYAAAVRGLTGEQAPAARHRRRHPAGIRPQRPARARRPRARPGADPRRRASVRDPRHHRPRAGGIDGESRSHCRAAARRDSQAGWSRRPHRGNPRAHRAVARADPARLSLRGDSVRPRARSGRRQGGYDRRRRGCRMGGAAGDAGARQRGQHEVDHRGGPDAG